ncbi:MAG: ZIP family metal transporter [Candidatus Aenigmatarchaeota archaeon]
MDKILLVLVSFSAGVLMGSSFFHLIIESSEFLTYQDISLFTLLGFMSFFLLENVILWHHCHRAKCKTHSFGYVNLVGDSIHNFIDGLIIATSFLSSLKLGLVTSLAVILHEIPQEIGDFGILIYAGFNKKKAIVLNFLSALIAVLGGLVGCFLPFECMLKLLPPFVAGGFIYIAASDLIPEIRERRKAKKSLVEFGIFLFGILLMYALALISF